LPNFLVGRHQKLENSRIELSLPQVFLLTRRVLQNQCQCFSMSLTIDSGCEGAYKSVADLKSETNWATFELDGKTLKNTGSGSGGIEELGKQLEDGKVQFGCFQVFGVDQQENLSSKRSKILWFTWVGPKVSVLVKARVSVQKPEVAAIFPGAALALELTQSSDLDPKALSAALLKSGGAHKPTYYDFGGGVKHELA